MKYKVLVIAPAWVGDMVMAQTLFLELRRRYGVDLILDVYASNWASDLLKKMPEVNSVINNPFPHGKLALFKRIVEGVKLRKNNYDQVFVLPNSLKSAIVPFFAGIKKRTGFIGEFRYWLLNDIYKLDKKALPLMVDRFCALSNQGARLECIEFPRLAIDLYNQTKLLTKFNLISGISMVAFCPAAEYGVSKRWPPEYFAKLAQLFIDEGHQVVIFGSLKDNLIASTITGLVANKERISNLCGKTTLTDVVDLFASMDYVVTNDSGLMHVACATGVKVIAIYGSSSPDFTPPLSKTAQITQIGLECSPCFARTCRYGHYNCLKLITPQMVLAKLRSF